MPKVRYGNSISGSESNTQLSNCEADSSPLSYCRPMTYSSHSHALVWSRGGRSHFFRLRFLFLFKNFLIRVRQFFKFENPTLVQTPATIIDPTVIYPCFYFRNDRTDSCCCRNLKVTPEPGPVKKRSILQESTPVPPLVWRSQQSSKK